MEEWERLLENYDINSDSNSKTIIKTFSTTISTAKCALDEDLAPFESDWIFSTLLKKPVNLLEVVGERRMTDEYSKCIVEALKLLGDAVDKYDNFEKYYEELSQLCLLQYPAVPRQQALCCLSRVCRRAPCAARGLRDHLHALQQGVCMAPLAVLIGTICEYHPHVAADDIINIWRVFLNLLDPDKYSGAVMKAVLQGILGLFKHFGDDLPSMELIKFYEQLVSFLDMSGCREACLAILTHHARLFFTCLTRDGNTRALLWRLEAFETLQAVYAECDSAVLQEVQVYLSSPLPRVRAAARRLRGGKGGAEDHHLEGALRSGAVDDELGEQISWSIRTTARCNQRLLQAAMLFYDSLSTTTRTDVLLAVLNSPTHVVNAAMTFLVAEISRNQKLTIWHDIFKCDSEKLELVYNNINKYIDTIVEGVAEDSEGQPPLRCLLPLLLSLPPRACVRRRVRATHEPSDATALLMAFSGAQNIPIDDCAEDEVKIKCSLIVLYGLDERTYPLATSLAALQTIFSTKNLEAAVLSKAVTALDILARDYPLDECVLDEIIHNLEKIRKRMDKNKKVDRILYRDIFMFVGKHRKTEYIDNDLNSLIVELNNTLSIQIPHATGTIKVSLSGVLYSALQLEDVEALKMLTSVLVANLSSIRALSLQRVLVRVCVCLCACACDVTAHMQLCDARCAPHLLQYIMKEKSSESRKALLESLELLIRKDTDGRVLENIVENIIYVDDQNNSPAFIHTLDTINNLLKDNNSVCRKLLPTFVIRVLKTPKSEHVLINTYKVFLDKMYIFKNSILNGFITEVIKTLNVRKSITINNITLDFVKNVLNKTNGNINDYMQSVEELNVFVSMKRCFDFDITLSSSVLERVRDKLFEISYDLESVLVFLEVFFAILLEREYEKTIPLLSEIIESLTLEGIRDNDKKIVKCMKSLKNHLQVIPQIIIDKIQNYIKEIDINKLSESVKNNGFTSDNELTIHAVKVMIEALDGRTDGLDTFIVTWKDMFRELYDSGYVKICLESKVEVLSDLTFVALIFMNEEEIERVILQGPDGFGASFASSLMSVFVPHLSARVLARCSPLLHHVVTHNRGGRGELALLVDQIWPYYEKATTFRQKRSFLLDYLPHSPEDSAPVRWATSVLHTDTDVDNKLMILDVLPKGEVYGGLPLLLLPLLPTRLSELEGSSSDCFRAILDSLVTNTHAGVLDAVATLAANEPVAGWWDSALDACMSGLSRGGAGAERRVWDACGRAGHGAFLRLMIPLLRHSKPSVVENFVSSILEELLSTLRSTPRGGLCPRGVQRHLNEQVRAFNVLEIVFQRVPREHVESPGSPLYRHTSAAAPYHLVSVTCKLCVSLRTRTMEGGGGETHGAWLVANYNCLSWALLCRRPRPALYGTLLEPRVWAALLEHSPAPTTGGTWRPGASISLRGTRECVTHQASSASSVRSRVFLRTLSENPLAYDLIHDHQDEEVIITDDIQLPSSPLNTHPCMPALTALLTAVGGEGGGEVVREGVLKALEGEEATARFFAQAVCNARETLTCHSGSLTPALCALVVGRVNDLHLHVLDTIIYWRAELFANENFNKAIESIIVTAVENGRPDSLYRMLMDKLMKLLDIYGEIVSISWSCFEKYFKDPKSKFFEMCLRILNRVNIVIPELFPALCVLPEPRTALAWSVYGRALRGEGEGGLTRYRSTLEALRRRDSAEYIRSLYYVQREHPPACDTQHYRSIVHLVPKIPRRERPRCLSILSAYVERCGDTHDMLDTLDLLGEMDTVQGVELATVSLPMMSPSLRASVCASAGARRGRTGLAGAAYRLLLRDFELNTYTEPSIKRPTLTPHPHIYTAVGVARGLGWARENVRGFSSDLGVRFCECFILCVVVPLTHNLNANLCAVLDLFLQEIKQQEVFKNAKLSEDPSELRYSQQNTEVNIQTSIEDVLNSIIKFARRDEAACTSIIIQIIKALGTPRAGFDLQHTMRDNIGRALTSGRGGLHLLEIARHLHLGAELGMDELSNLVNYTRNSEGEAAGGALYQELILRRTEDLELGNNIKEADMPEISAKFSMKDLISTFGKLSNWDSLTRHQHTHAVLSPLWTDGHTLTRAVEQYDFKDSPLWLRAMVSKYKGEDMHTYKVLKDLDRWPRKHFDVAAVLESLVCEVSASTQTHIHGSDCMSQWAARIMVGSLSAGSCLPSRSLAWCQRGNEMGLYRHVLECCTTWIKTDESCSLKLVYQEMLALRGIALERNDSETLRNLLVRAESYNPLEMKYNSVDMLGMNELTLRLRRDVNSLEKTHVDSVITYMKQNISCNFKTESISTICMLGMTHYDKTFAASADVQEQSSLLRSMCELLGLHGSLSLPWTSLMSDVLLQALDHYRGEMLDEEVAGVILNTLHPIVDNLDECSINQLKSNRHLFPEHDMLRGLHQNELSLHQHKQRLSLICDPEYLLQLYCRQLIQHADRGEESLYKEIFMKMKRQVFENTYSGPEYSVLHKYLSRFNEINDFATDKQTIKRVLVSIHSELTSSRETLNLSDVCPSLSQERESESLSRLLGLRRGLRVVKFEEKMRVFTSSVCRPVLVSFVCSSGVTGRCIVKREGPGGGHAAVVRARGAAGTPGGARGGYKVNTLSEECILIQYLERHTQLRALLPAHTHAHTHASTHAHTHGVSWCASPEASRAVFLSRCSSVPAHTLRSAIEARCATFQDFLYKKKNFQESVCWMTILNFLFGVSDRHLENILYCEWSGAACDVDCGDLAPGDLPPARLTRNILALCDVTALEGSLQRKLSQIREHQGIILPSIIMSFKNTDEKFRNKVRFIQGKIQGSLLAHQVSRETIRDSSLQHRDQYVLLLEQIFGTDVKPKYSVEEQISSLLVQCTDTRILSVTRAGWEPWI